MSTRARTAALLLAGSLLITACAGGPGITIEAPEQAAGTAASPSPIPPLDTDEPIPAVVERVSPAVVNVRVNQAGGATGTGTGFVVRRNGIIVTNFHVVEGAFSIQVTLADGREFEARAIGGDPNADLAILQIEAQQLPTVELGDSDALRLGETVVALGFALALEGGPSVTSGIVSAKGRSIETQDSRGAQNTLEELIQTDAPINPGNSGGPLVDLAGRVIGINTAGVQASEAENIGFAIAINRARPIIEDAIASPEAEAAYLGVSTQDVTPVVAAQLDLPVDEGALVRGVAPGTGAEEAGIVVGDVIVEIEGQAIGSSEDLGSAIREHAPGDEISITVIRDGGARTVTAELGVRPLPTG
ncbi:MAG TPA: trypsin-like peptidase domain-containing protein [Actinomycetota bacterium]